eukprot:gnl/TRDRNA2_/TRDRNA2_150252_c0_seq5.p1 gnl/TRDRNA2_/TRDRNA2_150252_c0~~gnl/TRDRNA2_/TRDRNA2_150252_c0_seq5.p1  ORF type:complete len:400 (+),score=36.92 gnl/TRDRNA2_/TRDRNA2_150252_c0_seq5:24-1223(+)
MRFYFEPGRMRMGGCILMLILLACIVQEHAKQIELHDAFQAQDFVDMLDKEIVDELHDRTFKPRPLCHRCLDDTIVGKSSQLAIFHTRLRVAFTAAGRSLCTTRSGLANVEAFMHPEPNPSERHIALPTTHSRSSHRRYSAQRSDMLLDFVREVTVDIACGVQIKVLQAGTPWQEHAFDKFRNSTDFTQMRRADPFGLVVWPVAEVVASIIVQHIKNWKADRPFRVLDLGAGCGLVSLAAAKLGAMVHAMDLRQDPLYLLEESAEFQGLRKRISTQVGDICDFALVSLQDVDLVVASDVLYEETTAACLAQIVAQARVRGIAVLVGDGGRRGCQKFEAELRALRPREPPVFERYQILAASGVLHQQWPLPGTKSEVRVLRLPPTLPQPDGRFITQSTLD